MLLIWMIYVWYKLIISLELALYYLNIIDFMWFNSLYFFLFPELTMASNRGLNQQEILDKLEKLDKLFADDHDEHNKHVLPGIGVDTQSDAEEGDTVYEEDSEDED